MWQWRLGALFLAALVISGAQATEKLTVGIEPSLSPLSFVDANGTAQGYAVDVMRAVAREMQLEIEFRAGSWDQVLTEFRAGRLDALANVNYTGDRAGYIGYTTPYLVLRAGLFENPHRPVLRSLDELPEHRIAVKAGSPELHYLIAHGCWAHLVIEPSLAASLKAVVENRADAAIEARLLGLKQIADDHLNLEPSRVALPDLAIRLHAGFQPEAKTLIARFNEGLARLAATGELEQIRARWLEPIEPTPIQGAQLRRYLWPALAGLAALTAVLLWQRRLLQRLARQTNALRHSEERLQFVLEGTEDGFWDWDLLTGHVERSERWATMLGFAASEIPPTVEAMRALVHPDDLPTVDLIDPRRVPENDQPHRVEIRLRSKSGDWRWIVNRGKVVARSADGAPQRMAGTHTDITNLRLARDEATRQEARFRVVFENAPVGLSWMCLDRPESRFVNPAYERITGVSNAEGRRHPGAYLAATHPEDRLRETDLSARLSRGELQQATIEKRYLHRNGRVVWAIMSQHLFRDPVLGELHKLSTLVDLSERKRTESDREALNAKMLEAQKLESLGVLAGGIAHDFNNLLTVILANASFAREEGGLTEPRIAPIETAARRAADLCRQMLAYAGKGSVLLEPLSLETLVRETTGLLQISISKKASLQLDLAPQLPLVEADATQLRQVVMNLVINASEALGEAPGEIRISTRSARPAEPSVNGVLHRFDLPNGECLCLEIADTGQGMSAATLSRIFDPFFTTKFAGRGLGLAAVLGIVRAHRGALSVESTQGRGSVFRLYLPVSRPAAPLPTPHPAAVATTVNPSQRTLLIADDEPAVLGTVDIIVRRQGYHTVLATNGDEAVKRFCESPDRFAAVILDLTMPGRDGAEVLAAIRAERALTRVLVMSGFSEADIIERLRGCGEVVILRKPFTQETLIEQLTATLADPPVD